MFGRYSFKYKKVCKYKIRVYWTNVEWKKFHIYFYGKIWRRFSKYSCSIIKEYLRVNIFIQKNKILNFGNIDFLVIFMNYYQSSRTRMQKIKFEIMNTDNRRE